MRRGEVGGGGREGGDREKGNIKEDVQYNGEISQKKICNFVTLRFKFRDFVQNQPCPI